MSPSVQNMNQNVGPPRERYFSLEKKTTRKEKKRFLNVVTKEMVESKNHVSKRGFKK